METLSSCRNQAQVVGGHWRRTGWIVWLAATLAMIALPCGAALAQPHPLRIGFEDNPPIQVRAGSGFAGLAVDTVNEAARRAGIALQWVETGTSSDEAFRRGLVDLWPLMVDLPDRRKYVHFARPWIHTSHVLLVRESATSPDRSFKGRIAVFELPLHVRLARSRFPQARLNILPLMSDILKQVCSGEADAGFLEARVALSQLRDRPPECSSAILRVQTIPDLIVQAGVASTFKAAAAADRIEREIENMFRDGSLAVLIAKYSYFGLDDTWASYERVREAERWRWLAWAGLCITSVLGLTLWMASSLRQRKRSEAALRESEERFRTLANTAPVMIVASDHKGHASFFNKTWLDFTGRTLEQELGDGWMESVHPDERAGTRSDYLRSFLKRTGCKLEYRLRRADGEYRHVICNGVPRFQSDGVFLGFIASCIDITDMRNAQEEARARQNLESLGVMAGGIAHDFNNLLGATLALSELAQAKLEDANSPAGELQQIGATAIRGSEIVRQLMIYAGKESGTLEPVDVSSLVADMLELLKVSISKRAALATDLGSGLPAVFGNPAQIRQVIMNLITNASEAIGDRDGTIRVVTKLVRVAAGSEPRGAKDLREGPYLALEVSDTGCGMSPEILRRAFDPFFTTKFAGRGMGLAVVHQIVRRMGGSIDVLTSSERGASVQVLLPCYVGKAASNGHSTHANSHHAVTAETCRTVLVVEDEPALLEAVSTILRRRGFSVVPAADGTFALEVVRDLNRHIDALLLDLTLPGTSSPEIFQELARLRPEVVPIVMSAYSRESVNAAFNGLEVPHFIRKPFLTQDLLAMLQESWESMERKAGLSSLI